jgi:hypothetical protein
MYNQWKLFFIVSMSVFAIITEGAPYSSRDAFLNDQGLLLTRGQRSLVSELQQRAVCKFDVESEVDADSKVKYENVRCVNEVFGNCEQLVTSLTLPNGRSLAIKSACVFVNKTVPSEQAQRIDEPPKVT